MNNRKTIYEINGHKLKHGDKIEGSIQGNKLKGKLSINKNGKLYFCQNIKKGNVASNRLGYKYSWVFSINNNTCSDNIIIKKINNESINKFDDIEWDYEIIKKLLNNGHISFELSFYKIIKSEMGQVKIYKKDVIKNSPDIKLFRISNHPDCCGCNIIYNFSGKGVMYNSVDYFNKLSKEDLLKLKEDLFKYDRASKLAHLNTRQPCAIKFVEKLGFKKIDTYKNPKSGNIINIYNLNCYNK